VDSVIVTSFRLGPAAERISPLVFHVNLLVSRFCLELMHRENRKADRQTEIQTDRQTDRDTDRLTDRDTDR